MRIKRIIIIFLLSFISLGIMNCDSAKKNTALLDDKQIACYVLATCNYQAGVKFGMVGDSWTDLIYGSKVVETLRVQLEKYHGYKIVGATKAGETLAGVLSLNTHIKVIDETGPSIKYMLISMGGNDIQGDVGAYKTNGFLTEKTNRLATFKSNLKKMIVTGNAYKVSKYGGDPLLWVIHGYDFASPDNEINSSSTTTCRTTLKTTGGFTDAQVNGTDSSGLGLPQLFNEYNALLYTVTTEEPYLRYIDLRYTLGASASNYYMSTPSLYGDCIHPTSVGFKIIGEKYATAVKGLTNDER